MKVLVFTNMYPYPAKPYYGIFVKEQVESLKKMGVEIDVLFINGELSKLNYFKCFKRFFSTISKKKYDIIHCHHTYCAFIATLQKRIPVILTFHEGEMFSGIGIIQRIKKYGLWKIVVFSTMFKKFVLKRVSYLISVTKDLEKFVAKDKFSVIPLGVNLDLFKPISKKVAREKLGLPVNKKIILFPAAPNRKGKRFDIAKQSIDIIKKEDMDILLITLGNIKYEDVPYYMNAADVVLFTSDYEASPMVIKEAMACNIPIVSTDVGDTKWVIGDTEGCFICKRDPTDVATKIKMALNYGKRTEGRKKMIREGKDLISVVKKVKRVYSELIEGESKLEF